MVLGYRKEFQATLGRLARRLLRVIMTSLGSACVGKLIY